VLVCHSREMQTTTISSSLCCLLMVPLGIFSCSLSPHFFTPVTAYHLLKTFPCFSFPPACALGGFPSPHAGRWPGAARCCPFRLQGGMLSPAQGGKDRRGGRAPLPKPQPCLWLLQEGFHSSWGGGESRRAAVFTDPRSPRKCCVSVVGHEAWGVLESCASILLLPH